MALTNPNTPVSQQDLQDFYNKIKPYMGIYPSAMGKKIGKGDMYSTDEKMIGQWIDGKPLYQKTFEVGYLANKSFTQVDITTLMNTVDTVIDLQGIAVNESNKSVRPLCLADGIDSTNNIRMDILYENNSIYNLRVVTNSNWGENTYKIYSTLKYTKTTDSAISIGDDTDYSTEEKIVGTWIDGKPVYQKTIQIGNIAVVSSVTYKNLGVTNADTLISSKLWYTFSDGNKFDSEFLIAYNYGYACSYIDYASHKIYMAYKTSIALFDMFATIQYTKTTD